jgi:antitoxin VapB
MTQTAKVFMNGGSQAVRLPAEYRFDTSEVYIWRDPETGNVILSKKPLTWDGFFEALAEADVPDDFLSPEERHQGQQDRDPFAGWQE